MKRHHGALLLDPGLGKTTVALKSLQTVRKHGGAGNALVIAPLRVAENVWTHDEGGELHRWRADFGDLKVSLLHGPTKDRSLREEADLYVINFEGLPWLVETGGLKHLVKRCGVNVVIFDELSKFKTTSTQRFKLMKKEIGKFSWRWGLTGSPATNGLEGLFGQMFMIDAGATFGRYITPFRYTYFERHGYGGYQWRIRGAAEEKAIYKAIKPYAISMRAEDHLESFPKLVVQNLWVNLPSKAQKIYDQMEQEFVALLDNGETITSPNTASARGRCRQISSGGIYLPKEDDELMKLLSRENPKFAKARETVKIHDEKTKALIDLIDELQGSPLLVGYEFRHDFEHISEALKKHPIMASFKKRIPAINGDTNSADASRFIRMWNRGEIPVLCAHPASAGHGLNLQQAGNHVCWYTITWDFELYDQMNRRVWRQGNESDRVIVHHIVSRGTVDEDVIKTLGRKKRTQDSLFRALMARVRGSKNATTRVH